MVIYSTIIIQAMQDKMMKGKNHGSVHSPMKSLSMPIINSMLQTATKTTSRTNSALVYSLFLKNWSMTTFCLQNPRVLSWNNCFLCQLKFIVTNIRYIITFVIITSKISHQQTITSSPSHVQCQEIMSSIFWCILSINEWQIIVK